MCSAVQDLRLHFPMSVKRKTGKRVVSNRVLKMGSAVQLFLGFLDLQLLSNRCRSPLEYWNSDEKGDLFLLWTPWESPRAQNSAVPKVVLS